MSSRLGVFGFRIESDVTLFGGLSAGVAANHEAWGPQLVDLCGTDVPNQEEAVGNGNGNQRDGHEEEYVEEQAGVSGNGIQACAFDNRGVGRSSMPEDKKHYRLVLKSPYQNRSMGLELHEIKYYSHNVILRDLRHIVQGVLKADQADGGF